MAYEKYIKKDGKVYGPYIYHSKRIDGKVISEYHGQKKLEYKKFLWIVPFVLLIVFGAYFIGQRDRGVTGYSILDLNGNYQEGKMLEGGLKLSLEEGELIPASSTVVFENAGSRYEYQLKDMVSEPITEGNFFVSGKNISGFGEGFGIPGEKEVYPEVYFTLLIYSPIEQEGDVITESEEKVQGSVSSGKTFTYQLKEGERAELESRSVKTSSGQIPEDSVLLKTEEGIVSVSTDYSEKEEGFGDEYSGKKMKEIEANLDNLNLSLEKGDLKVGIFYGGEEITSMQTTVSDSAVSGESEVISEETSLGNSLSNEENIQAEQPTRETTPTTTTNEAPNASLAIETRYFNITFPKLELTAEETAVLEKEFGNIFIEVKEEKIKNGFIIIKYELREDTWVNYSYDSGLNNNTLNSFMRQDRIKWLKDLAKKYSA